MKKNKKTLAELFQSIKEAIENGVADPSLIEREDYQRVDFVRGLVELHQVFSELAPFCVIDRRRTLCNIYASYCDATSFPFVKGEERNKIFLAAISKHFVEVL